MTFSALVNKNSIALLIASMAMLLVSACLGEDPNPPSPETTQQTCTDGEDNDQDGHFDCYDPECRSLSEQFVARGDSAFCKYSVIIRPTTPPSSSSLASSTSGDDASSSSTPSSSSGSSSASAATGFPIALAATTDTTELFALIKDNDGSLVAAGRRGMDGFVVRLAIDGLITYSSQVPNLASWNTDFNSGNASKRIFHELTLTDTSVLMLGQSFYNPIRATYAVLEGNTHNRSGSLGSSGFTMDLRFLGPNASGGTCYAYNDAKDDAGALIAVDTDASAGFSINNFITTGVISRASLAPINGTAGGCVAVGYKKAATRDSMLLLSVTATNAFHQQVTFGVGGAQERAIDIAPHTSNTFLLAATVDAKAFWMHMDSDATILDTLDLGTANVERIFVVSGGTRSLLVGSAAGLGQAWLVQNSDGTLLASLSITSLSAAYDAVELTDGSFVIAGTSSGAGVPQGMLVRANAGLTAVVENRSGE